MDPESPKDHDDDMDPESPKDHDDDMDPESPEDHDDDMDPESPEDHDDDFKLSRGAIIKTKSTKGKVIVEYNKKGVPVGEGATKLATFEGSVARTLVPISYETWRDVDDDSKEDLWQYVNMHFVLDPTSRKNTLKSIGKKWRNYKHYIFKQFVEPFKDDPQAADLQNCPAMYPHLEKEDWEIFVSHRLTSKWQKKSERCKKIRAHSKYNHRLSRKGYAGLTTEIMEQTGLKEEEIDRTLLWKKARELKTGGYTPDVKLVVDKIDELQKNESLGEVVSIGKNDVLTQALGTQENRGQVRGMGRFVTPQEYFIKPTTIKHYLENEEKKWIKRLDELEGEVEQLKKSRIKNASEGASSYMLQHSDDFEDEQDEETLDQSCLLAVNVASNIVANGTIMKQVVLGENIEVLIKTIFEGEALLPIPLDEEFIVKVKDAAGHVVSWPRHLVARCSDLEKLTKKPDRGKKIAGKKEKEKVDRGKKIVVGKDKEKVDRGKEKQEKVDVGKEKEKLEELETKKDKKRQRSPNEGTQDGIQEIMGKRRTQADLRTRKIEDSRVLKMTTCMVDSQVTKMEYVRVQSEDFIFGYDSYTCVNWQDFEVVFTMDQLTGSIIDSYMMYLYETIKHGMKKDHGICFVSSSAISAVGQKSKVKHGENASRCIADRLSTRKDNNFIVMPYNPGGHWVLAILDMNTLTCYYFDSLRPRHVDKNLKHIVDTAMMLYAPQSNSSKRSILKWINRVCPRQPGDKVCGYCVLKYMKDIVFGGVEVLINEDFWMDKDKYDEADFLDVREDWASYVSNFIFK